MQVPSKPNVCAFFYHVFTNVPMAILHATMLHDTYYYIGPGSSHTYHHSTSYVACNGIRALMLLLGIQ
ncbi:hypothetical protein F5Y00DRAFT_245569 [Daldinia vernicosa]|uniref:uncharacterized protein n=1 Tax=Daldinia vernicosa TaxID=114800 RepID=UPI002008968B|nr:uncharacterized protein F5Y00DRAFT_245569 [Daldinia vernicosa]KAI0845755.1 hypothetical protein F5Y00DRAFT_245569 [Daldinia vernicosa]